MTNIKIIPFKEQETEAVIFDLGGVILDLDVRKTVDAFLELGFDNVEEKMARIMSTHSGSGTPGIFQLYETGQINNAQFRDGLRKYASRDMSDENIDKAWTAMLLGLPPANIRLLEKLGKSYKLYLLSNTNAIHIETLARNYPDEYGFTSLVKLFDKVYYSHVLKMRKPDVEIFRHVIEDARLDPGKTVFIDDSMMNIEGAKAAGLLTLHHKANAGLDQLFESA
jgi:glucose-1-phosphatase